MKAEKYTGPAPGYKRICVDLSVQLVAFLDRRAHQQSRKLEYRVTRTDVIREGLLRFKNSQI